MRTKGATPPAALTKYLSPKSGEWKNLAPKPGDTPTQEENGKIEKAQDSLKETLLFSLQMQNIIVLTGCGTSRSAGGPSMKDLWEGSIFEPFGISPSKEAEKVATSIKYALTTPMG